jgi:hypothetical protein
MSSTSEQIADKLGRAIRQFGQRVTSSKGNGRKILLKRLRKLIRLLFYTQSSER